MTSQIENQPHSAVAEQPKRSRSVRHAGALLMGTLAMVGNPEESQALETATTRANVSSVAELSKPLNTESQQTPRLRRITELPAWGVEVTKSEAEKLQDSTLKLEVQHKELGISGGCTFVKVKLPSGSSGGITAAHCFENLTGYKYGLMSAGRNGYPDTQEARDILSPNSPYEFFVLDPKQEEGNRLGKVTGISVKPGEDIALLKFESLPKPEGDESRTLEKVPAITYKSALEEPKAGQKIAYSSVPSATSGKLIGGSGVYIGRMKFYNIVEKVTQLVDVVAQSPKSENQDAGSFGASGGSAALKGGQFFHSLSGRVNIGYSLDNNSASSINSGGLYYWNKTQKQLGVRLPKNKFNALSFYQVQTRRTVPDLEAGFGKYITMELPRK
ncbi:hypothetical protein H0X09_04015 [Candidatus Saccharibacteria bacterium]|nr:hypothetical protein [Candidatus Saccharibacteria bacterium]